MKNFLHLSVCNALLLLGFSLCSLAFAPLASARPTLSHFQQFLDARGTLWDNRYMRPGDAIQSPNRQWAAKLLADGNLCVSNAATPDQPNWCMQPQSPITGHMFSLMHRNSSYIAYMQRDGNLCVYRAPLPMPDMPGVICTGSNRPVGQMYALALGNDGVLAVHVRSSNRSIGGAIWTSAQGNINPELMGGQPMAELLNVNISQNCTLVSETARFQAQITLNQRMLQGPKVAERMRSEGYQARLDALPNRFVQVTGPIALADEPRLPARCSDLAQEAHNLVWEISNIMRP